MKPSRPWGLPAAYAAVFALALGVTVTAGLGWAASRGSGRVDHSGPPLTVLPSLGTQEVFFGDEIDARVEVVADGTRVHLGSLHLGVSFAPYSVAHRESDDQSLGGGYVRRVTTYRLRCLQAACLPAAGGRRAFRFAPLRVGVAGQPVRDVQWPQLLVVSRLHGTSGLRVASLRTPSAVSGGKDWSRLVLLASGGLALAGLALVAVWGVGHGRRPVLPAGSAAIPLLPADPVADACARVRTLFADASWTRRRGAIDALAGTLAAAGEPALALDAQSLAWRRAAPSEGELDALLERVEHRGMDDRESAAGAEAIA